MTIWRHTGGQALGDSWNLVSWLLQRDVATVAVSTSFPNRDRSPLEMCTFVKRIEALMDAPRRIELIERGDIPTVIPQRGAGALWDPERLAYTPTKLRWSPCATQQPQRIGYQFDGRSAAPHNVPSPSDIQALMVRFPNVQWVRLGLPLSLETIVQDLAGCTAFIGCDSGVSHVAHSVGVPMVVWSTTEHAHTRSMHPAGPWRHAKSLAGATSHLEECVR